MTTGALKFKLNFIQLTVLCCHAVSLAKVPEDEILLKLEQYAILLATSLEMVKSALSSR